MVVYALVVVWTMINQVEVVIRHDSCSVCVCACACASCGPWMRWSARREVQSSVVSKSSWSPVRWANQVMLFTSHDSGRV